MKSAAAPAPGAPAVDPGILAAAAGAPAGEAAAAPAPAPAAPATSWRTEALSIWQCVASLGVVYPSVRPIYTDQVLGQLADAWAPILERHQITMGNFLIYFVAAGATLPVAAATYQAIRADAKAMKAGRAKPAAAPDVAAAPAGESAAAPGGDVLAFGTATDDDKPNAPLDPGVAVVAPAAPVK